jgi:hypothetical protein
MEFVEVIERAMEIPGSIQTWKWPGEYIWPHSGSPERG